MFPADQNISLSCALQVVLKAVRVNRLVSLGIKAVPAQNVLAGSANEDVCQ